MNIRKHLLFLLAGIFFLQAHGQRYVGNWDAYVLRIEQKPVSVVVDLDFGNSSEAKEKRNVIIIHLMLLHAQADGMPERDEMKRLDSIENALVAQLDSSLNAQYTGRYTQDGKRSFYFYTNDTSDSRFQIAAVLDKFPAYSWNVKVDPDDQLSHYMHMLYPPPREMERIKNKRMADALYAKGDLLTAPRKVDHFIFFKTEADRKKFMREVQDSGFIVENAGKEIGVNERPYSLQISRTDKVDSESMDKVSLFLWERTIHYSGKYEGWETFVVK